jgi:hypothetical protein
MSVGAFLPTSLSGGSNYRCRWPLPYDLSGKDRRCVSSKQMYS